MRRLGVLRAAHLVSSPLIRWRSGVRRIERRLAMNIDGRYALATRSELSSWHDRVQDPALTPLLIVQCLLIFVTAPVAATGFPGSRIASEVVFIAFAILVVFVARGGITVVIAVVAASFTVSGSLVNWLTPSAVRSSCI